jgi:lipopolysaccharide/colanic/teichoic acid biosynthesis glycosyltransferase
MIKKWDSLPDFMKKDEIKPYYDILVHKKVSLFWKRFFDIILSLLLLIGLSPIMIILALLVGITSRGGVFFRQVRVTKYGRTFRIFKLLNILSGDMTVVGTRPEVEMYVNRYSTEMFATLLLPAGVTSQASIEYKDEEKLLAGGEDVDEIYVNQVLPEKMKYNLDYLKHFTLWKDLKLILKTVLAVLH